MKNYAFAGYALRGELDLNRLAVRLGMTQKYRWEEPMILTPQDLRPLALDVDTEEKVYLYYFGAVVFVNCSPEVIETFRASLALHGEAWHNLSTARFHDEYVLQVSSDKEMHINNNFAVMPNYDPLFSGIICFVIAKSVALERIEERLDQVLDEVEGFITRLERGWLTITDKRLARMASTILSFKYASLANIMVLDKPESTWENEQADRLYLTMANIFELSQRYNEIRHKSETLLDITEVFTSLSHARRASRLEWIIIILIAIEIVIYLVEILK
ncbi:MAG: RMD1 family protein [Geobacteraceae bacterium]